MNQDELERLWQDPQNWKLGIYMCPDDPRVVVPKRIPWTGYTLNFSRKAAVPVLVASLMLILTPFLLLLPSRNIYLITSMFIVVVATIAVLCHWESTRER